ncbi:MAG: mechanosensitive ion channel family protein [Opitutaceae bacterium]|jgi:MscS family membrane protein|nr:mechanosensitive ion channel family protein [Opitutaceae bacterium]
MMKCFIAMFGLAVVGAAGGAAQGLLAEEAAAVTAAGAAADVSAADDGTVAFHLQNGVVRRLVDGTLRLLEIGDARVTGNRAWHYVVAAGFVVVFWLGRRLVVPLAFKCLRALAGRTRTKLDDRMADALEQPAGVFVTLTGLFAATRVLFFPETLERVTLVAAKFAFLLTLAWAFLRALNAVLDFWTQQAVERRKPTVLVFMPWIRRTAGVLFALVAALLMAESFGFHVKPFLAGLGLGGLAFALAAQDTLANLFGAVVVAMDQPFRPGDYVKIGDNAGTVEDIGLRSTKLRTPQKSVVVIPNKTVAAEAINNFSRMGQRRVEQTLGLTYDTTPEKMEQILADLRQILAEDSGVAPDYVVANFTAYGESSLDIQVIYYTANPDFRQHLVVRERVNLAFMRAVAARGLSFAFPSQTVHFDGEVARKLAEK